MENKLFQALIESGGHLGQTAFWVVSTLGLLKVLHLYFSSTLNFISKNNELKSNFKIEKLRSKRKTPPS
jgi:hypothetical protein